MDRERVFRCPTCGKILDGIILDYSWQWPCSKCAKDQNVCAFCGKYQTAVQAVEAKVKALQYDIEDLKDFDMRVTVQCPHYTPQSNIR